MPITTFQQLTDLIEGADRKQYSAWSSSGDQGSINSQWTFAKRPVAQVGTVPATGAGVACDRTTVGGLVVPGVAPAAGKKLYLVNWRLTGSGGRTRTPFLMDRLVHTSGLSGTLTTVQTVNSAALPTRGGTGEYVEAALEWYTATGATATTATVIYVDDGGTSRTTTVTVPATPSAGRMEMIPHLAGVQHRGIRSITSVQLAASTLTAGNFGVTLFKRICTGRAMAQNQDPLDWRSIGIPKVDYQACMFIAHGIDAAGGVTYTNELLFAEEP